MQTITASATTRALEFGIYRDGDNNLDEIQAATLTQALDTSARDHAVQFTVEDTTARDGAESAGEHRTESYRIVDGQVRGASVSRPHDMSARSDLARFVARTLDDAQAAHARSTWLDLVDHGGGDGGGLETAKGKLMRADDIAGAIADGVALHARAHPEDADRRVDGVVANQCLMSTLAFASGLSHAGVRYLAASPETMLAPGVPSSVASGIAAHLDDPQALARGLVGDVMRTRYQEGDGTSYGPAAAFDVLDLDPANVDKVTARVKTLNDALAHDAGDPTQRAAIREDARSVDGMVRFEDGKRLPWRADRSAISLYSAFADDTRLDPHLRADARAAESAVRGLVLAHRESRAFAPFGDTSYRDAIGPNVHFPLTRGQVDPWAPQVSETDNAFFRSVDGRKLDRAVA